MSNNITGEDRVYLMFVTANNHISVGCVTRAYADTVLQLWLSVREKVRLGTASQEEIDWLQFGSFSPQMEGDDGKVYLCSVIAWTHVIALYMKEIDDITPQERHAAAQEKAVEWMIDEAKRGNEWRAEDDEEGEPGEGV